MQVIEIQFGTPAYDESIQLRTDILRIPLGLEFFVEDLEKEYNQFHLGCYNKNSELVGCLVLNPLSEGVLKMRQVAVSQNIQKKGIGSLLVHASEDFAKKRGFTEMVLNARETAVPFYEKLNYTKIGERFEEVNIPHFKMKKDL